MSVGQMNFQRTLKRTSRLKKKQNQNILKHTAHAGIYIQLSIRTCCARKKENRFIREKKNLNVTVLDLIECI